jgi:hypothetical protein
VGQRAIFYSSLNALRFSLARMPTSLNQNAYVGTLGVFLAAGIATLNGRMISVGQREVCIRAAFGEAV